jgi:hypothetical protein
VVLELAPGVEVTALATAIVQRLDTASVMATTEREDEAVA